MTKRSLALLTIDRLSRFALPGLAGLAVAKSLGASNYGKLSWAIGIASLLTPLTSLGSSQLILSLTKKYKKDLISRNIIANGFRLQILGSLIALPIYILVICGTQDSDIRAILAFLWLAGLFQSGEVVEFWLIGRNEIRAAATSSFLSTLANFLLKILGATKNYDVIYFAYITAIGALIKTCLIFTTANQLISKYYTLNQPIQHKLKAYMAKRAIGFSLSSATVTIYLQCDIVMLGLLDSSNSVGAYGVACLLLGGFTSAGTIIPTYYYPKIDLSNSQEVKSYFKKTAMLAIILIPLYIGTSLTILRILQGDYQIASGSVMIISPLIFLSTMGSALGNTQSEERLESHSIINTSTGAIFNIGLNLILIPVLSLNGAAIAFIASSLISGYVSPLFNKTSKSKCFKYYINPF